MPGILQLIDKNFLLHAAKIPDQTAGMKVMHSENVSLIYSGLSCDTFNIIHITNGKDITDLELSESVNYFRDRKLDFCIWVSEENLTGELLSCLSQMSLVRQGEEVGMALDLELYNPVPSDKHQQITRVTDLSKLSDYSRVIAENWNPPDQNVLAYYKTTADHYLHEETGVILLLYYQQNKPLATVELFPSDHETIGIYGLATLEDARGRGIGSALMTYALNEAKKLNYKWAVLQASAEGFGIYQKLGFQQYTTYYEYA